MTSTGDAAAGLLTAAVLARRRDLAGAAAILDGLTDQDLASASPELVALASEALAREGAPDLAKIVLERATAGREAPDALRAELAEATLSCGEFEAAAELWRELRSAPGEIGARAEERLVRIALAVSGPRAAAEAIAPSGRPGDPGMLLAKASIASVAYVESGEPADRAAAATSWDAWRTVSGREPASCDDVDLARYLIANEASDAPGEALAAFEQARGEGRRTPELDLAGAALHHRAGSADKALALLNGVIGLAEEERSATACLLAIRLLLRMNDFVRAEQVGTRARKLFPRSEAIGRVSDAAVIRHVKALEKSRDWPALAALLPRFLADPRFARRPIIRLLYVKAQRLLGRADIAWPVAEQAVAAFPHNVDIWRELAETAWACGRREVARDCCREMAARLGAAAGDWPHVRSVQWLRADGRLAEARAAAEEGLSFWPESSGLRAARAELDGDRREPARSGEAATALVFGASGASAERVAAAAGLELCPSAEQAEDAEGLVCLVWEAAAPDQLRAARRFAARRGVALLSAGPGAPAILGGGGGRPPEAYIVAGAAEDGMPRALGEAILNDAGFTLSAGDAAIARDVIAGLAQAYRLDAEPPRARRRVLLIDERVGDKRLALSLGSDLGFRGMIRAAAGLNDVEVTVRLESAPSFLRRPDLASLLGEIGRARLNVIGPETPLEHAVARADVVFVCSSDFGFDAALLGKEVHCFAAPFYAGWGVTRDHVVVPRRRRDRSIEELCHVFCSRLGRYLDDAGRPASLRDLLKAKAAITTPARQAEGEAPPPGPRVVFVIPGHRLQATGLFVQKLAEALLRAGAAVLVLYESRARAVVNGVTWIGMRFEGAMLRPDLAGAIEAFRPDVVYLHGIRTRAQRAAVEIAFRCRARLIVQFEDDDGDVYQHHARGDWKALTSLDKPNATAPDLAAFLGSNDWDHTLSVLFDPSFDRWIEPVLRLITIRLASGYTAIWRPYAERLQAEFGKPTIVVPPTASAVDFERSPCGEGEAVQLRRRYGLKDDCVIFFIAGQLYAYSEEFEIFLGALRLASGMTDARLALVVTKESSRVSDREAVHLLGGGVDYVNLETPPDDIYLEMLRGADVICSPGVPNPFNRYRLPSRLVGAMAMGKAICTNRAGFGESLIDGDNAFLLDGVDPQDWAKRLARAADAPLRAVVGRNGKTFARENFSTEIVGSRLLGFVRGLLAAEHVDPIGEATHGFAVGAISTAQRMLAGRGSARSALKQLLDVHPHGIGCVLTFGRHEEADVLDLMRIGAQAIVVAELDPAVASSLRELGDHRGKIIIADVEAEADAGGWLCRLIADGVPEGDAGNLLLVEMPPAEAAGIAPALLDAKTFDWFAVRYAAPLEEGALGELDRALSGQGFVRSAPRIGSAEAAVSALYRARDRLD